MPNYYVEYNRDLNKYIFKFDINEEKSNELLYPKDKN